MLLITSATDPAGVFFQNRWYDVVAEVSAGRAPTAAWSGAACSRGVKITTLEDKKKISILGGQNHNFGRQKKTHFGFCRDTHGTNVKKSWTIKTPTC